jgi:adenine-specific DNA-methyltransferase
MNTVFIGGSRDVTRFNEVVRIRLQAILDAGLWVFVGDANGADKAAQRWFAVRAYSKITVFHSSEEPRNNLGRWQTRRIVPKSKKKDFFFHAAKDLAMAEQADYGFMLWDGVSKGTLNNILNLLERRKKVVVYLSPAQECITLRQIDDVIPLLSNCPKEALEEFEAKIDLGSRILPHQAKLNLV